MEDSYRILYQYEQDIEIDIQSIYWQYEGWEMFFGILKFVQFWPFRSKRNKIIAIELKRNRAFVVNPVYKVGISFLGQQ